MKKTVLFAISLLTSLGSMAEDNLAVENVTIPQGGTAVIAVNLNNPDVAYAAFQFRLTTATGIAVARDASDKFLVEKGSRINTSAFDDFSITTTAVNATTYDLLAWQLQTTAFPGTSGTIVNITLQADASLAPGSTRQCTLSDVQLSDTESNSYDLSDVSFTVTIGEQEDGRLKFDENSTSLPAYTAGEKADVTMKRTINADDWSTIVLPFTLPKAKAEAVFGSDAEYYKFSSYETTVDVEGDLKPTAIKINFTKYELANALSAIAGGQPYLIKTKKNITEIRADDVKLVGAVTPTTGKDVMYEDVLEGKFTGTFVKTTIPANGLFISDNKFWYSSGSTNVKAFRAWFELDAVLDQTIELSRIIMNFDDGEPTGIQTNNRDTITNDRYYDLQGRSVQTPARKGLYINNGKKVVVK